MGRRVIALSGGVGGAKLAWGLAQRLAPDELAIVCNTGDDFEHLGLPICPDLDTVMYTLAGLSNVQQGWGLEGESWRVLDGLRRLGSETWFRLGDMDMATHLQRGKRLREGASLTEVTFGLCAALGVRHPVWPMSDDPVRTMVRCRDGELAFQHYFVREQCRPAVNGFRFDGIDAAKPQAAFVGALRAGLVSAVLICPSNPFVSVDPILSLPGVRRAIESSGAPVLAVSPIVGGEAIKGPAAKMMAELGMPVTALAVASHYQGLVRGMVIDRIDAAQAAAIEALGMKVLVAQTVMRTPDDKAKLAEEVLAFARRIA